VKRIWIVLLFYYCFAASRITSVHPELETDHVREMETITETVMAAAVLPAEELPAAVKRSGGNPLPAVIQPGTLSLSRASHPVAVKILQTKNKKKHQINAKIMCLKYKMSCYNSLCAF